MTVHLLVHGVTICGLVSPGATIRNIDPLQNTWPTGDTWVGVPDKDRATCTECLATYDSENSGGYRRSRRLPLGQATTRNVYDYLTAWQAVIGSLLEIFDGYDATAFDPDIVLTKYERNGLGKHVVTDRVVLSTTAAQHLISRFASNKGKSDGTHRDTQG